MKIAQVAPVYPPYCGGIGGVAKDYTDEIRKAGHEVTVFTPKYKNIEFKNGAVVALKSFLKIGKGAVLPQLFWRLRKFDIVHLHYPFYGGAIFTALSARIFHVPLVVTYHMKTQGQGLLGFIFRFHRAIFEKFILNTAKVILVNSLDYADSVGLKYNTLKVLPFWVDADRFFPKNDNKLREELKIKSDSVVFIFVGGLDNAHYFKGVDVLISAVSKLPLDKKFDVVMVGSGNRKESLEQISKNLGINKRVHFVGRVSNEKLPQYFQMADIHILPSIDQSEAFGLVTLEAGASGLLSLVSNLPGVRNLVEKGVTGEYLIPNNTDDLAKKMRYFIDNSSVIKTMGDNARLRILKIYSKEKCFQDLQSVYRDCILK